MQSQTSTTSGNIIANCLQVLTQDIGVRLAGSAGERRAAGYAAEQFERLGARVSLEEFPIRERHVERFDLRIRLGAKWVRFPGSLMSSTPGTAGRPVTAPLVFFETPAEARRKDLWHLTGKAVVHLGSHIESRDYYRRLMAARPAFLLIVDVRYPGDTPRADGMFPAYTSAIGAVPTVNVAFMDAWRWKVEGASAARLTIKGGMRPGISQNVVADLPGTDPEAGLLLLGAHHDTQADSVGADDNAVGVACLLAMTRQFAPVRRRRGIRLISFGAEEQLSVGSAEYVRRHRAEVRKSARLMFNLDACGSVMGWTELVVNGPRQLTDFVVARFEQAGHYVKPSNNLLPYSDHFPFAAAGIPSIFLGRVNCTAGRFFHHRPDDDMTRVSVPLLAEFVGIVGSLMTKLANARRLPFPCRIPAEQIPGVRKFWEDLYGGWGRSWSDVGRRP
jgi:carboxypeptidase Q